MDRPLEDREFETVGFMSGSFNNRSENQSVPEKEGFAIVESMNNLYYITMGRLIHIFTDHVNLLRSQRRLRLNPSLCGEQTQLMRWAM